MQDGASPTNGTFPSRRSLRESPAFPSRRSLRASGAPEPPVAAYPSRKSLREASQHSVPMNAEPMSSVPMLPVPMNSVSKQPEVSLPNSVHPIVSRPNALPLPSYAPHAVNAQIAAAESPRPRATARRTAAVACALVSAAGLFFAMSLPGAATTATAEDTAASLAHQELAGAIAELPGERLNSTLGSVSAEPTGAPVDFVNFRDARVQFPFATGQHLTDGFGPRSYPVAGFHEAQDFAVPEGTTVQAIAAGTIRETGWSDDGCGFGVLIEHTIEGLDVTSRYCHMQADSNDLEVGQQVDVGDPVGRVGATGLAFGAHLHFALTVDGTAVDPMPFLLKYNRETRT